MMSREKASTPYSPVWFVLKDDGGWLTSHALARMADAEERSVRRMLHRWCNMGWVEKRRQNGHRETEWRACEVESFERYVGTGRVTESQMQALEWLADRWRISKAEAIRRLIVAAYGTHQDEL